MSDLPVAGWYPDPAGSDQLRWWSGAAWTDHLQARPQPVPEPVPVVVALPVPTPMQLPMPVAEAAVRPALTTVQELDPVIVPGLPAPTLRAATSNYIPMSSTVSRPPAQPVERASSELNVWAVGLALTPVISLIAEALATFGAFRSGYSGGGTLLAVTIVCVVMDRQVLRKMGVRPPSPLWTLITVLYLIMRRRALRREGFTAPPLVLLNLTLLISALFVSFAVLTPFQDAKDNADAVPKLEENIAEALAEKTSTVWTVQCPDDAPANTASSAFSCTGTDSTGLALNLAVTIDAQGVIGFVATQNAGA